MGYGAWGPRVWDDANTGSGGKHRSKWKTRGTIFSPKYEFSSLK